MNLTRALLQNALIAAARLSLEEQLSTWTAAALAGLVLSSANNDPAAALVLCERMGKYLVRVADEEGFFAEECGDGRWNGEWFEFQCRRCSAMCCAPHALVPDAQVCRACEAAVGEDAAC